MAPATQDNKSKKKKKSKKKTNATTNANPTPETPAAVEEEHEKEEVDEEEHPTTVGHADSEESEVEDDQVKPNGQSVENSVDEEPVTHTPENPPKPSEPENEEEHVDATSRFDALVRDRDVLRAEVTQLRQSLEKLQAGHESEIETLETQLQETQGEKESAEEQYQNLLERVNTIRSQLGDRLKADAEDLARARTRIEELEEQKADLQERYTVRSAEVEELTSQRQESVKELSSLRNRATLSQQNWFKEKEELIEQESYMREEYEQAKQAMHDWEVLAMEERTIRRDLEERVGDMDDQLLNMKEAHDRATNDRDTQASAVEGLQKALQEIQTVRKKELKELVEGNQSETESLRKQLAESQQAHEAARSELEETQKELGRALPFEKEVKEKNLLIGKLRREGVTLNEHLTKALRFLKKGKSEDTVDRQIVTNHLLHFLTLDRSDPKKFQILQLIAALLNWTDEQRAQAGLSRPGGNGSSSTNYAVGSSTFRIPGGGNLSSLMHRTPSSPALSVHTFTDPALFSPTSETGPLASPGITGKETLAELWQSFLEQEAASAGNSNVIRPGLSSANSTKSRQGSMLSVSGSGNVIQNGTGMGSMPK